MVVCLPAGPRACVGAMTNQLAELLRHSYGRIDSISKHRELACVIVVTGSRLLDYHGLSRTFQRGHILP